MQFNPSEDTGCAYPLGDGARPAPCGAPRRPGSSYCPAHHALCRLPRGSPAEQRVFAEWEKLAAAVGGRYGPWAVPEPTDRLLRRLERVLGPVFLRPNRSCYVHGGKMPRQIAKHVEVGQTAALGPTPERLRQGLVEPVSRPIPDSAGRLSRPHRAIDTLAIMERRGSITSGMRQAGEDFRSRFAVAQLDPLRAADPSHLRIAEFGPRLQREPPGPRIEAARRQVWQALRAVGGVGSPAGSCLWHVVGWQLPVKEWALHQGWSGRRVSQEAASGILIAALGALESHLGGAR